MHQSNIRSHAEDNLKELAMEAGPSCPLQLGMLDSPDYWTDNALFEASQGTPQTQTQGAQDWNLRSQNSFDQAQWSSMR